MRRLWNRVPGLMAALVLLAVAFLGTGRALAVDRVTLKDGTVVEGTIYQEHEGYVWIKTTIAGIEQKQYFAPEKIAKVEKGIGAPEAAPAAASAAAAKSGGAKAPKALVLSMGDRFNHKDMVGIFMNAHPVEMAIPTLEKELGTDRTGVLVLRISSGGGSIAEIQPINDLIHTQLKPRFRTVAWIDSAISAAAMSALVCDEIYFTTRGNFGACTGFYGSLDKPVEGFELEKVLAQMEETSRLGGWDPILMRAMQIQQPVSADIDENGNVKFYPDAHSGAIRVNEEGRILTLSADLALKIKFSRGTADTLEELTKLMGYQELGWVGEKVKGIAWPVSRAERMQMEFRDRSFTDQTRLNEYNTKLMANLNAAAQVPKDQRAKFVGPALDALEKIKGMVRNNPNFSWQVFGRPGQLFWDWIAAIEKQARDLLK